MSVRCDGVCKLQQSAFDRAFQIENCRGFGEQSSRAICRIERYAEKIVRLKHFDEINVIRLIGRGQRDCVLKRLGRFLGFVKPVVAPAEPVVHLRSCGRRRYEWL